MNILKNRLANKRKNIYERNNIYGDKDIKLTFKKGIKSVDIPDIFFNNYFKARIVIVNSLKVNVKES